MLCQRLVLGCVVPAKGGEPDWGTGFPPARERRLPGKDAADTLFVCHGNYLIAIG